MQQEAGRGTATSAADGLRPLKTKLTPPVARPSCVPRTQLQGLLQEATLAKLVLLDAPAGFGKTTLLLQWLEHLRGEGRETAWLTLDDGDNDAMRFIAYLEAALGAIAPVHRTERSQTGSITDRPSSIAGLLDVIEWIAEGDVTFTLFLDEFETIRNPEIHDFIGKILQSLPPDRQIVIASRESPQLPLARMKARGQLVRIGAEELRFSAEETAQFLCSGEGPCLAPTEMARLHEHSEGWAAGLQLAALALAGREDRSAFIESFSGSFRDIADYLAEDVLARQTGEVRDFLLKTSILDRMSGPLCNALTGRTDGYDMLAYLERANLFVLPLDDERHWYRYHNLFAQFLRTRLKRGFWDRVAALHTAASTWFEAEDRFPEAAKHALAAGEIERAAELMGRCSRSLVRTGQLTGVAEWCERLPRDIVKKTPELRLDYCWSLAFLNRFEEARSELSQIRSGKKTELPANIHDEVLALEGVIQVFEDRVKQAQEISERNISELSDRKTFAYGTLADTLGYCYLCRSQYKDAENVLTNANLYQMKVGTGIVSVYTNSLLGLSKLLRGQLKEAVGIYRRGYDRVVHSFPHHSVLRAVSAAFLAEALYEQNNLDAAEGVLHNTIPVIREHRPLEPIIFAYRTLSRVHHCRGQEDLACRLLDEGEALGREAGAPRLTATLHMERVRIALQEGNVGVAEQLLAEADEASFFSERQENIVRTAWDPETPEILRLRLSLRCGRAEPTLPKIRTALGRAESTQHQRQVLKLRILEAEALAACGDQKKALRTMRSALEFGGREGYVRSFADEGAAVARLIRIVRDTLSGDETANPFEISTEYLDGILSTAGHVVAHEERIAMAETPQPLGEDLTAREVEVLELSGLGLPNRDIAERLFLSVGTVKFHLRNVNMKLGARNRTEALLKARQRGLIS